MAPRPQTPTPVRIVARIVPLLFPRSIPSLFSLDLSLASHPLKISLHAPLCALLTFYHTRVPMASGTRQANADKHPGDRHNEFTQKRRTPDEIKRDKEAAAAQKAAQKAAEEASHRQKVTRTAQFEERCRLANQNERSHVNRPDLRPENKPVSVSLSTTIKGQIYLNTNLNTSAGRSSTTSTDRR